jgi:hypothetical protein
MTLPHMSELLERWSGSIDLRFHYQPLVVNLLRFCGQAAMVAQPTSQTSENVPPWLNRQSDPLWGLAREPGLG